jgi:hypothetical protein
MVYDPHNQVIVLFGGKVAEGYGNQVRDTWLYDYQHNSWTELVLTTRPSARDYHDMVYCTSTNEILMYGGGGSTATWSLDCESQTWSRITTTNNPGVIDHHTMAYDTTNDVVILYGGFDEDGVDSDQTWQFDCSTREWAELEPTSYPMARYAHAMVYDESINKIVMCCGNTIEGTKDETWTFDISTTTWTLVDTNGDPGQLKLPHITYDSINQKCIIFGGQIGQNFVDDTLIYDAQTETWSDANPDLSPPDRILGELAFDSRFGISILFGGKSSENTLFADTWAYNYTTNTWTDLTDSPLTTLSTPSTSASDTTPTTNGNLPTYLIAGVVLFAVILAISVIIILRRNRGSV